MDGQCSLPSPIAIDGPAASGKSTVGRALAMRFGYRFVDTGLMYRAYCLAALQRRLTADMTEECCRLAMDLDLVVQGESETHILLDGEDVTAALASAAVEANVSPFSQLPCVRERMVRQQRELGRLPRVVMAGRDIGSVVLPNAPLKIFLEADEMARAGRRGHQAGTGIAARANVAHRDGIDRARTLQMADAVLIDTTNLSLEEVVKLVVELVECASA